ncbi:MAG: hypothetical protein AAGF45_00150 [Pseudomonadota bacterium]
MSDNQPGSVPASGSSTPSAVLPDAMPSFGVVGVLKTSFSVYSSRFIIITFVVLIANSLTYLAEYFNPDQSLAGGGVASFSAFLISIIASFVAFSLSTAFVVQISFDAKMGRRTSSGVVLKKVFAQFLPLILMSVVASIVISVGFLALILPGLYLLGMLAVYVPAIVVERKGYGAFKRSAELTKGYRWPVIGAIVILYLMVVIVAAMVVGLITGLVDVVGIVPIFILAALIEAVPTAILAVATAMMYARLLEIKEGVAVDDIAKVFA